MEGFVSTQGKRYQESCDSFFQLDKNRNLESSCTMSFADTSGDLPSVFPVRIRLRFREPEVTLFAKAVRKPGTTQMEAYIYKRIFNLRFYASTCYLFTQKSYFHQLACSNQILQSSYLINEIYRIIHPLYFSFLIQENELCDSINRYYTSKIILERINRKNLQRTTIIMEKSSFRTNRQNSIEM